MLRRDLELDAIPVEPASLAGSAELFEQQGAGVRPISDADGIIARSAGLQA